MWRSLELKNASACQVVPEASTTATVLPLLRRTTDRTAAGEGAELSAGEGIALGAGDGAAVVAGVIGVPEGQKRISYVLLRLKVCAGGMREGGRAADPPSVRTWHP